MANERLRDGLLRTGLTVADAASKLDVDAKTVERWVTTGRTPYPKHRQALAVLLGAAESYLWPSALPPERRSKIAEAEIVGVYPHRAAVPTEVWDRLLDNAGERIDVLVHAGQLLIERPDLVSTLAAKAGAGCSIRIDFGDPAGRAVSLRGAEEQLGKGVLAARIRYGLVSYRPLLDVPGIEFRFHRTTLYNSIFRFDDEMIANMHVYGVPGARAPALHLRRLGAGELFDTYVRSFADVWALSGAAAW